jgi:hypothetical protein
MNPAAAVARALATHIDPAVITRFCGDEVQP